MAGLLTAALVVGVGANGLAWAFPGQVRQVIRLGNRSIEQLERLPLDERPPALIRLASPADWEHELGSELAAAASDAERVAAVNELLAGVAHQLQLRAGWPRAAVWLAASGQLLVLVAGFLLGGRAELIGLLPLALASVVGCSVAGQLGRRAAQRQRHRADRLVEALAGELAARSVAMPARRRRRR